MPGYHRLTLPAPYRALLDLDAAGFAWEWLRRNPRFRARWQRSGVLAQRASARALVAARRSGLVMLAGQHFAWTAWVDGAPFMTYHFYWTMGEDIEPRWDNGDSCYRVKINGDAPLEVTLTGGVADDGRRPFLGLPWTGLLGATAVQAVCDAAPGVVTHLDPGVVRSHGLVRR